LSVEQLNHDKVLFFISRHTSQEKERVNGFFEQLIDRVACPIATIDQYLLIIADPVKINLLFV
jgi:hypothetical protein